MMIITIIIIIVGSTTAFYHAVAGCSSINEICATRDYFRLCSTFASLLRIVVVVVGRMDKLVVQ